MTHKAFARKTSITEQCDWWRSPSFLHPSEEAALAQSMARSRRPRGSERARQIAPRVSCRKGSPPQRLNFYKLDPDEAMAGAMAAGCEGLLKSLSTFDPAKGTFRTHAWKWIDGEIKLAARFANAAVPVPKGKKPVRTVSIDALLVPGRSEDFLIDDLLVKFGHVVPSAEAAQIASEESSNRHEGLAFALNGLDERERRIFSQRQLSESPPILQNARRRIWHFTGARSADRGDC